MIVSTPKLTKAAARAQLEEAGQITAALEHATTALKAMPLEAALALHEQYATRWPSHFASGCTKLKAIIAEHAALKAEHRACDEWLRACDTLRGQALLDTCGKLAVRYPKRFGAYFETIRELVAVQRECDEARMFDSRRLGLHQPMGDDGKPFPYYPPSKVERHDPSVRSVDYRDGRPV